MEVCDLGETLDHLVTAGRLPDGLSAGGPDAGKAPIVHLGVSRSRQPSGRSGNLRTLPLILLTFSPVAKVRGNWRRPIWLPAPRQGAIGGRFCQHNGEKCNSASERSRDATVEFVRSTGKSFSYRGDYQLRGGGPFCGSTKASGQESPDGQKVSVHHEISHSLSRPLRSASVSEWRTPIKIVVSGQLVWGPTSMDAVPESR